jgi:hypothetical protein
MQVILILTSEICIEQLVNGKFDHYLIFLSLTMKYISRAGKGELWIEQCWRDVLQITWDLENNPEEFYRRAPPNRPLVVSFSCCQQFIMSRAMVHKRPLRVWQRLLKIINEQDVCHIGEPDYEHLYSFKKNPTKVGPEPSSIVEAGDIPNHGYGAHTQGGAMEHLSHVVFGGMNLDMNFPEMKEICEHYVPNCPFSPCQLQRRFLRRKMEIEHS